MKSFLLSSVLAKIQIQSDFCLFTFKNQYRRTIVTIKSMSEKFQQDIFRVTLKNKPSSTVTIGQPSQDSSLLQEKLAALQHQYVKMESEYMKKVKELKSTLFEKTKKQQSLTSQLSTLREQFKVHQEEILKVGEQLKEANLKESESKHQKKNSSPGLIKKSLEIDKQSEKKQSPLSHPITKNHLLLNLGPTKNTQHTQNSSPQVKRQSPKNVSIGFLNLLKKQSSPLQTAHKLIMRPQQNESKPTIPTIDKSSGQKKKGYSPTAVQHPKPALFTSIKQVQKEKANSPPAVANISPQRIVRRSPGAKVPIKLQVKKEGKHLLGKLKEEMQEVF